MFSITFYKFEEQLQSIFQYIWPTTLSQRLFPMQNNSRYLQLNNTFLLPLYNHASMQFSYSKCVFNNRIILFGKNFLSTKNFS